MFEDFEIVYGVLTWMGKQIVRQNMYTNTAALMMKYTSDNGCPESIKREDIYQD